MDGSEFQERHLHKVDTPYESRDLFRGVWGHALPEKIVQFVAFLNVFYALSVESRDIFRWVRGHAPPGKKGKIFKVKKT